MIADDAELAERFHRGDEDAIRSVVDRYGDAVVAVVATGDLADATARAAEVFVDAQAGEYPASDGFGPWLASIAAERSGSVAPTLWAAARAISAIDPEVRAALRRHHLDGEALEARGESAPDLARHELRLERRLAHLGDTDDVRAALADPRAWTQAGSDLSDRVITASRPDDSETEMAHVPAIDIDGGNVPAADLDSVEPEQPSLVARSLRPVALGLGGAAVVLFVAVIVLSAASGTPTPPNYVLELTPTGVLVEVEGGEITVTERDAGIEIELDALTLPRRAADTYYEGRLVLIDGQEVSAGTFAEGDDVTLWGGVALDDVAAFHVVTGAVADPGAAGDVVLKTDLPRS